MIWWVGYRRVLGADHVRWPLLRREAWEVLAPDRDPGFGGLPDACARRSGCPAGLVEGRRLADSAVRILRVRRERRRPWKVRWLRPSCTSRRRDRS
jgi:hypothetical protein